MKVRLLTMSGEAEAALGLSVEAYLERNVEKAQRVIEGDRTIDALEVEIEEKCISLLALQQPMAKDLRMLTAALKISNDLERVGDHAVNIAESAIRLKKFRPITPEPELVEMGRLSREMLADALEAFIRGDTTAAREICLRDDQVDALQHSAFRIMLTHMMEDPQTYDGRPSDHRRRGPDVHRHPEPGASGRPGDQHRRGRRVPSRGQVDQASRRRPRRSVDALDSTEPTASPS
jgi:phosphate transport system protein